jgi:hypothetical protein
MLCGSVSGGEKLMYGLLFTIYNDKAITRRNKRAVSRLLNAGCPISRPKKAMKNGAENKFILLITWDYSGFRRTKFNNSLIKPQSASFLWQVWSSISQ